MLDVHWQKEALPRDEAGAMAYVGRLAGPHLQTLDLEPEALSADPLQEDGPSGWQVRAQWESTPGNGNPAPGGFVEWDLFSCSESPWLWTVVVASNEPRYLTELQAIQATFECPAGSAGPSG